MAPRHQFSGEEFDHLSRGLGESSSQSPDAFAKLRAARLSRHLLMLRAAGLSHDGQLAELQREHPDTFKAVLSRPLTGAWLAHCLRTQADSRGGISRPNPTDAAHLATLMKARPPRRIRCPGWEVDFDDRDPYRHARGLRGSDNADFARWEAAVTAAWEILAHRHPGQARAVAATTECLIPLVEDGSPVRMSATSHDANGAILLQEQESPAHLAATLVHESRHSTLNALHDLFPLFEQSPLRVYSPFRDELRPVGGLLHGVHAFTGVAEFWRVEGSESEFARTASQVRLGHNTLVGVPTLTDAGRRVLRVLEPIIESWQH